jgi:voltage-gated potassium channel
MFRAFRAMLRDPETKWLALAAMSVITIGSVVYMLLEHWSPVDAFYFCVVTLATVGYGDFHPTTELSRLFTVGYILAGLGIIAAFITELAKHRPTTSRVGSRLSHLEGGGGPLGPGLQASGQASAAEAAIVDEDAAREHDAG